MVQLIRLPEYRKPCRPLERDHARRGHFESLVVNSPARFARLDPPAFSACTLGTEQLASLAVMSVAGCCGIGAFSSAVTMTGLCL